EEAADGVSAVRLRAGAKPRNGSSQSFVAAIRTCLIFACKGWAGGCHLVVWSSATARSVSYLRSPLFAKPMTRVAIADLTTSSQPSLAQASLVTLLTISTSSGINAFSMSGASFMSGACMRRPPRNGQARQACDGHRENTGEPGAVLAIASDDFVTSAL